ncbi:hypothetical protein C8Q75DRAFT_777573 [Abortiporus biennis]|nr:hypothetical protein C8Q75DRAFT_777573 [Abortiporus biennis]
MLECEVCTEILKDPRFLLCGHIVCRRCLHNWIKECQRRHQNPLCPVCRKRICGVNGSVDIEIFTLKKIAGMF